MIKQVSFILLFAGFSMAIRAQPALRMTSLVGKPAVTIKKHDFIQCRYRIFNGYLFLAGGIVRGITDSTLVYSSTNFSAKKYIPLSAISNIDRISVKRSILPALGIGLVAGTAEILVNRHNSTLTTGLLVGAGSAIGVHYVFRLNHRQLNKNIVGETIELSVQDH